MKNILVRKKMSIALLILLIGIFTFLNVRAKRYDKAMQLSGIAIAIDPGHGGKDMGASFEGILEDEVNLSISQKLKASLIKRGAHVILTRECDCDLASEQAKNRKKEDMKHRVELLNQENVDLFISIHLNSFINSAAKGPAVFYQKNHPSSPVLAQIIQKQLNDFTNEKKTVKEGDYYILNETQNLGVLIECGFLSNVEERHKLKDEAYQEQLVERIVDAIIEFFGPYASH